MDRGRSVTPPSDEEPQEPLLSTSFVRSIPLFACAGLFVAAGVAVLLVDPHYGPGAFALWALLIVLGFVSAIGGIASWLLVAEPPPRVRAGRTTSSRRATDDDEPVATRPRMDDREAFGRPTPEVRSASPSDTYRPFPHELGGASAPGTASAWDEAGASEEIPFPIDEPIEFVSVEDALRDLDGIERDLAPRARPAPRRTPA